ncbi:hypothetical protein JIN84_09860 [Luteolibacter yonseiensis]|uniref:Uncharacterized protein n=1 Tax=Luteolibacter yonseiensis TaxID=1144680 RepID=A0A934R303_9BACT|nr:hypothetical protein [Luteolibacter yonseiensis]MBK1815924.1 hypothetical protein [Luteolibacter yonseiensis]
MSENPYTAPQTFDIPPSQDGEAELIRKEHLKTEASIKSIGILYYLGSIGILVIALSMLMASGSGETDNTGVVGAAELTGVALLGALAVFQFVTGMAVRKFKTWARIAVGILSGIGLLGFPVGTIINGYILYLIFSKKGQMVFSERYKEIIAATPHLRYKTPKVVWIVLGVIVAIVVVTIAASVLAN